MHRTPSTRTRPRARIALRYAATAALAATATILSIDAAAALGQTPTSTSTSTQSAGQLTGGAWARARAEAVVRNFADANGNELTRLAAGHPLRVVATSEGTPRYYEVEVAGGVPVWVFGELLQPTNSPGVLRVDAAHVNMRPLPESSPRSMALRTKLQNGTRLILIERQNPSKPLAEDWVKVWAPESARVWIETSQVDAVSTVDAAAVSSVQTAWVEAARNVPTARQTELAKAREERQETQARERALPAIPTVPAEAVRLIAEADLKFDEALAEPEPSVAQWTEVSDLYRRTHELAPEGTATSQRAFERLRMAEARREIADLQAGIRAEDERRQRELAEIMAQREKQGLGETVHWGRFQGRGWLQSRVLGGERRWYIEWRGETVAEVRCTSDRYDLRVFEGFELGVTATTISPPVAATALSAALPRVLDISRIEVISGGRVAR